MKNNSRSITFEKNLIGSTFFKTKNINCLLGARTAVHQNLMLMTELDKMVDRLPDTVFLSDFKIKGNVSCRDFEFIFLASLFLGTDFENNQPCSRLYNFTKMEVIRKFRLIVNPGEKEMVYNQLQPSLLGASRGFLKNSCHLPKQLWQMLVNEAHFFCLKDNKGKGLKIEDLVEIIHYDDTGKVKLEDELIVKKTGISTFEVSFEGAGKKYNYDINFDTKDMNPVWTIPQSKKPFSHGDISIIPLGTASPFNTQEPPTSYWLKIGSKGYLIDCGFLTDLIYKYNGGDMDSLQGLIITHCHGDHFNPIPYLYRGKPLELWTTIENYKLCQKITCSKAGITPREFKKRFIHKPIKAISPYFPAPRYSFGLVEIEFHYSIHSIPTIGLTIYKDDKKLMVFSSDMADLTFIKETLFEKNVIPKERYEMILNRFKSDDDDTLFLLDCGGDGFIHGKAGGYAEFFHDSTKVVECHRGGREQDEKTAFQLAEPLSLIPIVSYNFDGRATSMICQMLKDMNVDFLVDWASVLKDNLKVLPLSAYQPVIAAGNKVSNNFYLIDYGNCKSNSGLLYTANQWFGEESLLNEKVYKNTIHTDSPVRLLILDANNIKQILKQKTEDGNKMLEKIQKTFNYRRALSSARMFSNLDLPVNIIDDIVIDISTEKYNAGDYIYRENEIDDEHLFIIEEGHLEVTTAKGKSVVVNKNDIVGERVAAGIGKKRNASVKVLSPATLIRIPRTTFKKLLTDARIYNRIMKITADRV